jgi:predicted DNA-binding transcriptional regulator AlpA
MKTKIDASKERWIGLPTKGRCSETGLSRSYFYLLIKQGKIKSACLKEPGKLTGRRLVWLPSVLEYIERHAEPLK